MLIPGFTVQELPVKLSNQNNVRFAPDGTLTTLGYDGRIWRLRDTNGDGLEDTAEPFWDKPTLSVPVGMAWTTEGLYVSSHGKVSLLRDTDGDGRADVEEVVTSGWPPTDVGSGGVDATAVTLDKDGNVYFGLLVADYSNAYRLRKKKDLKPNEKIWLLAHDKSVEGDPEEEVSLYDIKSQRGTIQKFNPRTKLLQTVATGIRVPYALAFNSLGDLFNTDQEGETWMPNGNPLDELNLIRPGSNYGFPPRHGKWLPNLKSEPPVVGFGPQHESSCGMVFNDPHSAINADRKAKATGDVAGPQPIPLPAAPQQGLFGPPAWKQDAFVAGESRGKIWRVHLAKTQQGYVGKEFLIARLNVLPTDVTISPQGDLYICCHSGQPDWGTGPKGEGKIFKISYTDHAAPLPVAAWPKSATEVRVAFDKPIDPGVTNAFMSRQQIEFGEYVRAADRYETLKPPYAVVQQQDATPRGHLAILGASLAADGRTLVLKTAPHPLPVTYELTIPGVRARGSGAPGFDVDLDYNLTAASLPASEWPHPLTSEAWHQLVAWAPTNRASSGTESRAPAFVAGDWENGRGLFFGDKLQCAKCHRIRGEGATVGPDLSNLVHRDKASVLRDIRDPSATLHPDYVTYLAELKNGDTATGFIRVEEGDAVRLFDASGKDTVIPRAEIVNLHPTGQSLMPTGLIDSLNEDDVRNLLTFLLREPPVRSHTEVETVLHGSRADNTAAISKPLTFVLIASKQDHGPGQHDYPAWQKKWQNLLGTVPNVSVSSAWEWPNEDQFRSADALVFYYWNHDWSAARFAELDRYQSRGGGIALIHAAVISDKEPEQLAERIGLAAQPNTVKYRHTAFDLHILPGQKLTRGLPEWLPFLDEPYWPMVGDAAKVTVLASAEVDGEARPLIWTCERHGGRVFASILGHYTWTLDDPIWRLLCLRGIAWAANREDVDLTKMAVEQALMK